MFCRNSKSPNSRLSLRWLSQLSVGTRTRAAYVSDTNISSILLPTDRAQPDGYSPSKRAPKLTWCRPPISTRTRSLSCCCAITVTTFNSHSWTNTHTHSHTYTYTCKHIYRYKARLICRCYELWFLKNSFQLYLLHPNIFLNILIRTNIEYEINRL